MDRKQDPVGVFDSGVGGISALREMRRVLPSETFIYYGDIRNAPYGTKSTDEVIECARAVVRELLDQKIKALVIACNTATGAAAATLRRELSILSLFAMMLLTSLSKLLQYHLTLPTDTCS